MNKFWRIWAKALGQKEGRDEREADKIAVLRTLILLTYLITNCFIVSGVIRHWNANSNNTSSSILERGCDELYPTR